MAEVTISLPAFSSQQQAHFWNRVNKTPGQGPEGTCWEWQGSKSRKYGRYFNKTLFGKHLVRAHRVAFFLTTNIDPTVQVLHRCDNQPCCNPDHLWLGTHLDNVRDMWAKGRANVKRGKRGPVGYFPRPRRRKNPEHTLRPPKHLQEHDPAVPTKPRSPLRARQGPPITANPERYRTESKRAKGVGEDHPNAKLTKEQVIAIRYFHDVLGVDRGVLAKQYGVHRASIRDVVWRRSWAHV